MKSLSALGMFCIQALVQGLVDIALIFAELIALLLELLAPLLLIVVELVLLLIGIVADIILAGQWIWRQLQKLWT